MGDAPPPQSQRNVRCSGRTKADQSVLNDRWILFLTTSSSENFVAAQKNPCEQQMFKCEDERYELDMGMEWVGLPRLVLCTT